jgi:hypothetical protein
MLLCDTNEYGFLCLRALHLWSAVLRFDSFPLTYYGLSYYYNVTFEKLPGFAPESGHLLAKKPLDVPDLRRKTRANRAQMEVLLGSNVVVLYLPDDCGLHRSHGMMRGWPMAQMRMDSEDRLIEALLRSGAYQNFKGKFLEQKIHREHMAWALLEENRGRYSEEVLNRIFDTADLYEANKRWFGQLLARPNRNLIFESSSAYINEWIEELVFSGRDLKTVLNTCLTILRTELSGDSAVFT